jgi:phospholipid/cholesterol/gamma-HCH transport system substrate-binding protein
MKHEHINYLVVGSFVLAILVSVIATLIWISESSGPKRHYYSYYNNVAGLKYGAPITYEGFQVGQVEEIKPDGAGKDIRYFVKFTVLESIDIPDDSTARIISSGLLAQVSIDIKKGESNDTFQQADDNGIYIVGEQGANLFAAVADAASQISDITNKQINPLLTRVNQTVTSLADQADNKVPSILTELEVFSQKLNQSADTLSALLSTENQQQIQQFLNSMNTTIAKLDKVLESSSELVVDNKEDLQQTIIDLRSSLQVVSEHIQGITFNLENASRNINEFSRQIRENPGVLLGGKAQQEDAKGKVTNEAK